MKKGGNGSNLNSCPDYHIFERCSDGFLTAFAHYDSPQGLVGRLNPSCEASERHFKYINDNIGKLEIGDVLSLDESHILLGALGASIPAESQINYNFIHQEGCYKYIGRGADPSILPLLNDRLYVGWWDVANWNWQIYSDCNNCSTNK